MRAGTLLLKLSVFALVALACNSCRGASREDRGGLLQPSEAASVEDSGKRISGHFVLKSLDDDYGNKNLQGKPVTTFRFDEGGGFKIERESGGTPLSVEEGTYLVGSGNELVLYVEKVGGESLSEARVRRYAIADESAGRMMLRANPSATLVLEKK